MKPVVPAHELRAADAPRRRRVAVVGAGGLGHPVALSLVEAGVHVVLIDDDVVELSNLQRQVLFTTQDIGRPKVEAVCERLRARVPGASIEGVVGRVTAANVEALVGGVNGVDGVIDATDDPRARFVLNDWSHAAGLPVVLGGVTRFQGLVLAVGPGFGPCFRCLFEELEGGAPTCAQAGVIGALAGVVGHLEAAQMLAMLAGRTAEVTGFVTTIDAKTARIRKVLLPERSACRVCGGLEARLDLSSAGGASWDALAATLAATATGGLVEIVVGDDAAALSVPRRAREAGHAVVCEGSIGQGRYRALVRKAA